MEVYGNKIDIRKVTRWSDVDAYDEAARGLVAKFVENFQKFEVEQSIIDAGPKA